MSEIDQAFIKAYQEARATPPAKRPAAPAPPTSSPQANKTFRLDAPHVTQPAAAPRDPQQGEAPSHPRVPTPHLHFAARGAAWLERPQPQLVASVAQEFVAEEYQDEETESASATDPWIVPTFTAPAATSAPRAMGPGFGGPIGPKSSATPSTPDTYAVFSGSIKPSAPPANPLPPPLPVRPSSSGPWSPASHIPAPKQKAPPAERIAFVEKHTEEMTQQLTSVAHTLAMLEGNEPTEICLEKKEVTLVIRDAENEGDTLDMRVAEALEAKLAKLTPPAAKPELKIAAVPADAVAEVLEQVAEPIEVQFIEPEPIEIAPPAPVVEIAAKVAVAPPPVKEIIKEVVAEAPVVIMPIAPPVAAPPAPIAAPPAPKMEVAPVVEKLPPAPLPIAAAEKFQPQWEVDQFQWPDVLDRLRDRAGDAIIAACDSIQSSCDAGQKVLAITGVEEAMGSTTLLLALGRELGKCGMKVAIVDADFDRPTLAERTGLRIQHGWEATLTGSLPLEEVTVASLQDNVSLVPLVARQGVSSTMASLHAAKHLRRLRDHFDVVLIDAGVGSENVAALVTATADDALDIAVVLTVDERRSELAATSEVVSRLRHCGINSIQLGETFVSA